MKFVRTARLQCAAPFLGLGPPQRARKVNLQGRSRAEPPPRGATTSRRNCPRTRPWPEHKLRRLTDPLAFCAASISALGKRPLIWRSFDPMYPQQCRWPRTVGDRGVGGLAAALPRGRDSGLPAGAPYSDAVQIRLFCSTFTRRP
jgi:hypothetical protein